MATRRDLLTTSAGAIAAVYIVGPSLAAQTPFELWKTAYRLRMAERGGVPFSYTPRMIADDQTLMEDFAAGVDPIESADIEISYWEM